MNIYHIQKQKYHLVTFKFENYDKYEELMGVSDKIIENNICNYPVKRKKKSNILVSTPKVIKEFFGSTENEKRKQFVDAAYIDMDLEKAKKIWDDRMIFYLNEARKIAEHNKKNPWKYENPSSQSFGKFSPIIEHPKKMVWRKL
jgi:hypothetical protein